MVRGTSPHHAPFSPKLSNRNCEIAILFEIVKRQSNYVYGDKMISHSPWGPGSVNLQICPLFTYSICYWEVNKRFWGDFLLKGFSKGRNFCEEETFGEGGFFPGEILHLGNLPEFIYRISFICLTFSLLNQFYMRRCKGELFGGHFHWVGIF